MKSMRYRILVLQGFLIVVVYPEKKTNKSESPIPAAQCWQQKKPAPVDAGMRLKRGGKRGSCV